MANPLRAGALTLVVALLVLVGVGWAIGAGYDGSAETPHSVTNETVVIDVENWTTVDASHPYDFADNETVYNSSGVQLEESIDYEWDATNGSIYWYNSSRVTDGASASVSYYYVSKKRPARAMLALYLTSTKALGIGILLVTGVSVAGFAVWIHRTVSSSMTGSGRSKGGFR